VAALFGGGVVQLDAWLQFLAVMAAEEWNTSEPLRWCINDNTSTDFLPVSSLSCSCAGSLFKTKQTGTFARRRFPKSPCP
jgi:hypothetical protein